MTLAEVREELIELIHENLSVVEMNHSAAEVGEVYEELAAQFQALGIANLLLYANLERFHHGLIRSGHTRRAFLRKCREEGVVEQHQLAISRWESIFDAIVGDEPALASEIVALSPAEWVRDGEYEDDYCYVAFVHGLISGAGPGAQAALLERFERALEGAESARLTLCRALLQSDAGLFGDAFLRRLGERESEVERDAATGLASEIVFPSQSSVFVEGLALLRLAESAGFPTQAEYLYCPSLARLPRTAASPSDVFREMIERQG